MVDQASIARRPRTSQVSTLGRQELQNCRSLWRNEGKINAYILFILIFWLELQEDGATFRGLFIIDEKQNLRQITINDEQVGRSVDEAFRLVQAFQFADVHGEGNFFRKKF
jgi:hypothetical protein